MGGYLFELEKWRRKSETKIIKKLNEICFHNVEPLLGGSSEIGEEDPTFNFFRIPVKKSDILKTI